MLENTIVVKKTGGKTVQVPRLGLELLTWTSVVCKSHTNQTFDFNLQKIYLILFYFVSLPGLGVSRLESTILLHFIPILILTGAVY